MYNHNPIFLTSFLCVTEAKAKNKKKKEKRKKKKQQNNFLPCRMIHLKQLPGTRVPGTILNLPEHRQKYMYTIEYNSK